MRDFDANEALAVDVWRWLEAGVNAFEAEGRWAFRPYEADIGIRDDLADDLRAIYDGLQPEAQERWRWALHYALYGRDDPGDGTRVLIHLAVDVQAHVVLDALPGLLIVGDVHRFDLVFGAACALAGQTMQGLNCLECIRVSPAFDVNYAGHMLVALCRADPDGWRRHVEDMEPQMRELEGLLLPSSTAMARYARAIHDAVAPGRADVESARGWLRREWDAMAKKVAESA